MHKEPKAWIIGAVLVVLVIILLLWLRARQMTASDQSVGQPNFRPANYPYELFGQSNRIEDPVGDTVLSIGDQILKIRADPFQYVFNLVNYVLKSPSLQIGDLNLNQIKYTLPGMQLPDITPGMGDCGCTGNPYQFGQASVQRLEL